MDIVVNLVVTVILFAITWGKMLTDIKNNREKIKELQDAQKTIWGKLDDGKECMSKLEAEIVEVKTNTNHNSNALGELANKMDKLNDMTVAIDTKIGILLDNGKDKYA